VPTTENLPPATDELVDVVTTEPALDALARWEDAGAGWRLAYYDDAGGAVVQLLTCCGEPVDVLRSQDPELLGYLRRRPTSACDETTGTG
jgi:hypothetical protein